MGGNNGRGSPQMEECIQIQLSDHQRHLLAMKALKATGERLERTSRYFAGLFRAEIDQMFYAGVVRRGVARLFGGLWEN